MTLTLPSLIIRRAALGSHSKPTYLGSTAGMEQQEHSDPVPSR